MASQLSVRTRIHAWAAAAAILAAGLWTGGLVALGAFAAPMVFSRTPSPMSGDAMGGAFARYDRFAIAMAAVVIGAEVARAAADWNVTGQGLARVRRLCALMMAAIATVMALWITPGIRTLHEAGVRRGDGEAGAQMERLHKMASRLGSGLGVLAAGLAVMHVFTLPLRRRDEQYPLTNS